MTDADLCIDGREHAWVGDRTLYCEKCTRFRSRSGRALDVPIVPNVPQTARRRQARQPRQAVTIDRLVDDVLQKFGFPPTMWFEETEWVVECCTESGGMMTFRAPLLSVALQQAAWAKPGISV